MRPRSLNLTAFEDAEGLTLLKKESKKRVELKATNNGSTLSLYDNTETERVGLYTGASFNLDLMLETITESDVGDGELRKNATAAAKEVFGNKSGLELHDSSVVCRTGIHVEQTSEPDESGVVGYFAL